VNSPAEETARESAPAPRWPRWPETERERARATRFTFLLHLRPVRLPASTLRWGLTMGLGGSAATLFVLLVVTGALMAFVYVPSPGAAHGSVMHLENGLVFGALVRAMHFWSANLLAVVVLLHTARVFCTGGFLGSRRWNWVVGLALLAGVAASLFTGYLLPWDQLAYWAVTVATGMLAYLPSIGEWLRDLLRGGPEIGAGALRSFHTLHTTLLPACLVALMAFHFWRVRQAKGVVRPPDDNDETVMFFPHLLVREAAQGLVVIAVVVVMAAGIGAPLGEPANPGMSPNPVTAPWYFVGFQELLIHLHPVFSVLLLPLAAVLATLLLPWLARGDAPVGSWFRTSNGRRSSAIAAGVGLVATPVLVLASESFGSEGGWMLGGLLPTAAILAGIVFPVWILRRRFALGHDETLQAAVVLASVGFLVLTIIGALFRGPGMALGWPWS
jgi:quinol-cytochrome oxidoreductase complex cytochrome b subunit